MSVAVAHEDAAGGVCQTQDSNATAAPSVWHWHWFPVQCRSSDEGGPHSTSNFRSSHPGGCQFLFLDSSVHFLSESIDATAYRALSTIAAADL